MARIGGVLLDLSGVVFSGDSAIGQAVGAISDLRAAGLPVRFVTNTTSAPRATLLDRLHRLGIAAAPADVFTPASAARALIRARGLSPRFLVHPALMADFDPPGDDPPDAVVVGDAGDGFTFAALNEAFRLIADGAEFFALARNRTFQGGEGRLCLDAGPFVAALEYATRREARLIGKPAPAFYESARADLGTAAEATAMVGDDTEADVAGAMAAGMTGILVRTGKYRAGDETRIDPGPDVVVADLRAAADWVLARG